MIYILIFGALDLCISGLREFDISMERGTGSGCYLASFVDDGSTDHDMNTDRDGVSGRSRFCKLPPPLQRAGGHSQISEQKVMLGACAATGSLLLLLSLRPEGCVV